MQFRIYRALALSISSAFLIFGACHFATPKEEIEPSLIAGVSEFMAVNVTEAAELFSNEFATTGSMDLSLGYSNLGIVQVDENLNVRKEPSESASIIGKMMNDAGCEILSTEGDWYYIRSGEVTGYVLSDYVITGEAATARASEVVTKLATSDASGLRVREEPSTDSTIMTTMALGEELEVTEELDGWYQVLVDDEVGYISSDYVTITNGLQTAMSLNEFLYGAGVSDVRLDLVSYATQFVGNPYVWGGTSLTKGADCSGFVLSIYAKYGISLPHSSRAQANYGTRISASEAKPGDLFFYGKGKSINHVAIYIGNGQIVHASNRKTGIKISNCYYRTPICVTRLIND